jgi:hypothetical protein
LRIQLWVENTLVGTILAAEDRKDLLTAGWRSAGHGFRMTLPAHLCTGMMREMEIRCPQGRLHFRRFVPAATPQSVPKGAASDAERAQILPETSPCLPAMDMMHAPPALTKPTLRNDLASLIEGSAPREAGRVAAAIPWTPRSRRVLITGSAPTLKDHADAIAAWDGEIWALNDSIFWLNERSIHPDCLFVTDPRFMVLRARQLESAHFGRLVTTDKVRLPDIKAPVTVLEVLGRNGFSTNWGKVYHGCSVLFPALQCAFSLGYPHVSTCGILLSPPGLYSRIDGSIHMPEYVFRDQIQNARRARRIFHNDGIALDCFETTSNLRFV